MQHWLKLVKMNILIQSFELNLKLRTSNVKHRVGKNPIKTTRKGSNNCFLRQIEYVQTQHHCIIKIAVEGNDVDDVSIIRMLQVRVFRMAGDFFIRALQR